jgi:hypothetical protein
MESRFWDNVEVLRARLGKERKAVIAGCGLNHGAFTQGLTQHGSPAVDTACRIAQSLNTTVEYLVTGNDPQGLAPDERDLLDNFRRLDDRDRQDVVGIIAVKLERYPQKRRSCHGWERLAEAGTTIMGQRRRPTLWARHRDRTA